MGSQTGVEQFDRVALVIGNAEYTANLRNPVKDAALVTERLSALGFHVVGGAGTTQHEGENLSHGHMLWLIDQFLRHIKPGGTALIYYAGHGLQLADKNYLLPVEARLDGDDPLAELVPLRPIIEHAADNAGPAGTVLVFLDACRNNPFSSHQLREMADKVVARSVQLDTAEPDLTTLTRGGLASVKYRPHAGSARTFIAFATAPGDVAFDGDPEQDQNSPFATALARHIAVRGLAIDDFFDRVSLDVQDHVDHLGHVQDPWRETNLNQPFQFKPASNRPLWELAAAGLLAGLLTCLFLFDANGSPVSPFVDKRVWFLGLPFAVVALLGAMRWGSGNQAHAAWSALASMVGFAVAIGLMQHPAIHNPNAPVVQEGLSKVYYYFADAQLLSITLMALISGMAYAMINALGCKPQLGSFRGFGAIMGGIGVGLLVGVCYVLVLLGTSSGWPRRPLMITFGSVWFALLGAHLGWCYSYYVPEHKRLSWH